MSIVSIRSSVWRIQKVYCLADSHSLYPETRPGADIALIAGDFSNFGRGHEALFERLNQWGIPVYFASGNHETPELCHSIASAYGAVCLDYSFTSIGGMFLAGVGGYDIFSHAVRKRRVEEFAQRLRDLAASYAPRYSILLTHESPWPWKYNGMIRGNRLLRDVLQAWPFNLVVTGHFHEELPRLEHEAVMTPTLNPSFTGCLVDMNVSLTSFDVLPWN